MTESGLENSEDAAPTKLPGETGVRGFVLHHPYATMILVMVPLLLLLQWPAIMRTMRGETGVSHLTGSIKWKTDLPAAIEEASRTGKKVLVDFTASWCPPCQGMEQSVWPDAEVGQIVARSYIPVRQDVDDPAVLPAIERYHILGPPTILVLNGQGQASLGAHGLERDDMVGFLKRGEMATIMPPATTRADSGKELIQ